MNREIKFRAWTGVVMEYSVGASLYGGFYCRPDPMDTASLVTTLYSKETPIMQFTGLKDKNGKEIYEGDIVSHHEKEVGNLEVKFWNGQWIGEAFDTAFQTLFNSEWSEKMKAHGDWKQHDLEVIGNI